MAQPAQQQQPAALIQLSTGTNVAATLTPVGFKRPDVCAVELGQVAQVVPGTLPYLFDDASKYTLFLAVGPLPTKNPQQQNAEGATTQQLPEGGRFVFAMDVMFPNSYPVLIVIPPPGFGISPHHPTVAASREGLVFSTVLKGWNPTAPFLRPAVFELLNSLHEAGTPVFVPLEQLRGMEQEDTRRSRSGGPTECPLTRRISSIVSAVVTQSQNPPQQLSKSQLSTFYNQNTVTRQTFIQTCVKNLALMVSNFSAYSNGTIANQPDTPIVLPMGCRVPKLIAAAPQELPRAAFPFPHPGEPINKATPEEQYAAQKQKVDAMPGGGLQGLANQFSKAMAGNDKNIRAGRLNTASGQFARLFPQENNCSRFIDGFPCRTICGNGQHCGGYVYFTNMGCSFSTFGGFVRPGMPQEFRVSFPWTNVASAVRGQQLQGSGTGIGHGPASEWLSIFLTNGSVLCLFGWSMPSEHQLGLSTIKEETPCSQAQNWVDHLWRAATTVPNPSIKYGYDSEPNAAVTGAVVAADGVVQGPPPTQQQEACCHCNCRPKQVLFTVCGHFVLCHSCATVTFFCPACNMELGLGPSGGQVNAL